MNKEPKILVSILTYNDCDDTVETVRCFKSQACPNIHIQVVDGGSREDVARDLDVRCSDVEVVHLKENMGYAGGNNVAFERGLAEGFDYVVIANNDIAVDPDLVNRMLSVSSGDGRCGVVGAVEMDYHTGAVRVVAGTGFDAVRARGRWNRELPCADDVVECDYVQGALMMFTRRALEAGIRFDEKLFMYGEEVDVGFQLKQAGLVAKVDTGCRVRHKSLDRRFVRYQGYFLQRNRIYLARKHASRLSYVAASLYAAFVELPVKAIIRTCQGKPSYAVTCVRGFLDGIRGNMGKGRLEELL